VWFWVVLGGGGGGFFVWGFVFGLREIFLLRLEPNGKNSSVTSFFFSPASLPPTPLSDTGGDPCLLRAITQNPMLAIEGVRRSPPSFPFILKFLFRSPPLFFFAVPV